MTCSQANGFGHLFANLSYYPERISTPGKTSMRFNVSHLGLQITNRSLAIVCMDVDMKTAMSGKPHEISIPCKSLRKVCIPSVFEAHQQLSSCYDLVTQLSASNMFSTLLIKVLVVPVFVSCAILPQPPGTNDLLQGPAISPIYPFIDNSSVPNGNGSFDNILKLKCDPVRYGRNLKVESCRRVFTFITQDDTQTVFAERGSAQPHDSNLPFRATSSKCFIVLSLLYMIILQRHARTCNMSC